MKVVIVQSQVKQYRVAFFTELHARLAECGIDLRVVYSAPNSKEARKGDNVELDSGIGVKVPASWFAGDRLVYQHAWQEISGADLVVVEQASKHLLNYALLCKRKISAMKVAFWGHGFNRQGDGTRFGEFIKAWLLRQPDWWFGYTAGTVKFLTERGVRGEITTNVQNAIDTTELSAAVHSVTNDEAMALRRSLAIGPKDRVGIFCGALYRHKHVGLLMDACALIHEKLADFHLVVLGDGPDREIVNAAAAKYSWVHYVGPKFGDDRAPYLCIADLMLNPGLVGLGVLDAFAASLPILTMDIPEHSPEIEYLREGYNGAITAPGREAFARGVLNVMEDGSRLKQLQAGAAESARTYTLENMVTNFADGVKACLGRRKCR